MKEVDGWLLHQLGAGKKGGDEEHCQTQATGGNVRQVEVVTSLLDVVIYLALIRTAPFKLPFTYVLLLDYLMMVRGATVFLRVRLLDVPSQSWQGSVLCLLYVLPMPWLLHFFRQNAQLVFETDAPELWRTIWLMPALTSQRARYDQLQSYMEEICRACHDLRQHQNMILSYLESGDTDRLREYLQSQMGTLSPAATRKYRRNYAVNLLLNYYAWRFTGKKIDFEFQVQLLGNLLGNAQESCVGQEGPISGQRPFSPTAGPLSSS